MRALESPLSAASADTKSAPSEADARAMIRLGSGTGMRGEKAPSITKRR